MHKFDELDMKLLYELACDSSVTVPTLSKKLDVNTSVLYSRIKRLIKKKIIKKFTIDIDESMLGISIKASVGINRDPKHNGTIHEMLMESPHVISISEVTGRFDIIIQVYAKTLDSLHSVVTEDIGKITGIQNTETFVELQKTDKEPMYIQTNKK